MIYDAHNEARHTYKSWSPALDIAVPRWALCYLSQSNRGLKNFFFLQNPLFLALLNPGNHKPQYTQPSPFKAISALNKHRISKNQWTASANSLSFGADRSGIDDVIFNSTYRSHFPDIATAKFLISRYRDNRDLSVCLNQASTTHNPTNTAILLL